MSATRSFTLAAVTDGPTATTFGHDHEQRDRR
jgi:hypothetical protein